MRPILLMNVLTVIPITIAVTRAYQTFVAASAPAGSEQGRQP